MISEEEKKEEKNLFGLDYCDVGTLSQTKLFYLIKASSDYLGFITRDEIKDIKVSKDRNVYVLLTDGVLMKNGSIILAGINRLDDMCHIIGIIAIGYDNSIHFLECENEYYISDNNYNYKSIVITPRYIAVLTQDNVLKLAGVFGGILDYSRLCNVEKLGYVKDENNDYDVVVVKGNKVQSLFNDYTLYNINDPRIVYEEYCDLDITNNVIAYE